MSASFSCSCYGERVKLGCTGGMGRLKVQKPWRLHVRWSPFFQAIKWEIAVCPFLLVGIPHPTPVGGTRSGKASLRLVAFNQRQIASHIHTHSHPDVSCVCMSLLFVIVSRVVSMHLYNVLEGRGYVASGYSKGLGGPTPCVNIRVTPQPSPPPP